MKKKINGSVSSKPIKMTDAELSSLIGMWKGRF